MSAEYSTFVWKEKNKGKGRDFHLGRRTIFCSSFLVGEVFIVEREREPFWLECVWKFRSLISFKSPVNYIFFLTYGVHLIMVVFYGVGVCLHMHACMLAWVCMCVHACMSVHVCEDTLFPFNINFKGIIWEFIICFTSSAGRDNVQALEDCALTWRLKPFALNRWKQLSGAEIQCIKLTVNIIPAVQTEAA